jgi:hypothetical protein
MSPISSTIVRRLAVPAVVASAFFAIASAASASGPISVPERTGITDTNINVTQGQTVNVTATGDQIWSGVWFSGWNGPAGWTGRSNSQMPLPSARPYSLLASVAGQKFYVGNGTRLPAPASGRLFLQINDDRPGNGDGYFTAFVDLP